FLSTAPPPPAPSPLSLHDALPISTMRLRRADPALAAEFVGQVLPAVAEVGQAVTGCIVLRNTGKEAWTGSHVWLLARIAQNDAADRKSTRLNSSHVSISYAVFCLK